MASEIVDWKALLEVAYTALAAGIGVAIAFSVAVAGAARLADELRETRLARAVLFGAVGLVGLLACLAAIVLGITVMTAKD